MRFSENYSNSVPPSTARVLSIAAFCILLFPVVLHAAFTVHFKDGTSREVTKLEFEGAYVELYLTTGKVLRMRKESIDYKSTGIEPPTESNKVILKGRAPSDRTVEEEKAVPTGPSQEELQRQWDHAKESAVATHTFGSVRKGDTVRIVSQNNLGYTVIVKLRDGTLKRFVVNSEIFAENFELKSGGATKPSTASRSNVPYEVEAPVQETAPEINVKLKFKPTAPARAQKPSLVMPLLLSIGLLAFGLVSTVLLSKTDQPKKRKLRR